MLGISPNGDATGFTHGVIFSRMRGRTPAEPIREFPNRLREWRTARGLSLQTLADLTNQKHQSVARHETGENQITLAQMETYARALQIKPEELLNSSVRIAPKLRELIEILENLPDSEQERLVSMTRAFAEPRANFEAMPQPDKSPNQRKQSVKSSRKA